MKLFTKSFWVKAFESAIITGAATFAASGIFTTTPTVKGVIAAGTAAGMAALYTFIKALGGVQATNASSSAPKA